MTKIKIATWNVNSIKARLPLTLDWLARSKPDVVLLQEIKCIDFPLEPFENLGYNIAFAGQKSYNGVAILAKSKIEDVNKILPVVNLGEIDEEVRYIEAVISFPKTAIRVVSVYVPNGGSSEEVADVMHSKRFQYKLNFFDRVNSHFANLLALDEIMIIGGDFNVGMEEIDVYNPKSMAGHICFHIEERRKMRQLLNLGLTDTFRKLNPTQNGFTWWDYRANSWNYNKGLRIDYLLASPLATDKIVSCVAEDKGTRDQPHASDHCPVVVEIEI